MSSSPADATTPKHVGLVLDGNRRWASFNKLPLVEGHRRGAEVFRDISLQLFDSGVKYVSAYVFSAENWSRTKEEVSYLMKLVIKAVSSYLEQFKKAGIKIVILGSRERLSADVLKAIEKAESETAHNTKGTLALCFNYGGQQEIIEAAKALIAQKVSPDDITEASFEAELYGGADIPQLDLVIRTSGEQRLSGFMLYRIAYAEFVFLDTLWPDVTMDEINKALKIYETRQRRYGN